MTDRHIGRASNTTPSTPSAVPRATANERVVTLAVYRDGWTRGVQLALWTGDGGYRIAGPKFNGSGRALLEHPLTRRDADELRRALDWAFPQVAVDV